MGNLIERMGLVRSGSPADEFMTTAEARTAARVDTTADDDFMATLIAAARHYVEETTQRTFRNQSWILTLPDFPRNLNSDRLGLAISLPRPPVKPTSVVVTYYDAAGVVRTFTTIQVAAYEPALVYPNPFLPWPVTQAQRADAVSVAYDAGYAAVSREIPATVKHAMKLLIAHWYENREAVTTGVISAPLALAVENLLADVRVLEYR